MKDADFTWIKEKTQALPEEAGLISLIKNEEEYAKSEELMTEMIKISREYDRLIKILSVSLTRFLESSDDFRKFYGDDFC